MRKTLIVAAASAVIASAATATATALITSNQIANGTIRAVDIHKGTISIDRLAPSLQRKIRAGGVSTSRLPGAAGAAGQNGTNGTSGAPGLNGTTGAPGATGPKGDQGPRGYNADGSFTVPVSASGDAGFTIGGRNYPSAVPTQNTATIADGRLNLKIADNGAGWAEATKPFNSVRLDTFRSLAYSYTRGQLGSAVAPTLRITLTGASPCDAANPACGEQIGPNDKVVLFYEPTYSNAANPASDVVEAFGTGNQWWANNYIKGATDGAVTNSPDGLQSIQRIISNNPNLVVTDVRVFAGQGDDGNPWDNFTGSVDYLNVGLAGQVTTRYDFG